jgi:hypothetical protein
MVFFFLIYLMMIRTTLLYVFLTVFLLSLTNCKKETSLPTSVKSQVSKKQYVAITVDTALTSKILDNLLKPVYDTMNMKPLQEMDEEIQLSRSDIKRFIIGKDKFAAIVVENQYPFAGASTGHCDLFIFQFAGEKWEVADFMLYAGNGGMYGNSGHLNKMLNIGKSAIGFSIKGGQTHMGTLYYDDLTIFSNKKLIKAGTITTEYSYGDLEDPMDENRFCYEVKYSFIPSEKDIYDMVLTKNNCLPDDKNKRLDKITVPFDKKSHTYKLLASFDEN